MARDDGESHKDYMIRSVFRKMALEAVWRVRIKGKMKAGHR